MTDSALSPEFLRALKDDILSALRCALPGRVEAFHPDRRTADIRPMVRRRTEDGAILAMPLLRDVPVFLPAGAAFTVSPGDGCLLIFADCDISAWMETGEAALPLSPRAHDLSDAFAFVGFRPTA